MPFRSWVGIAAGIVLLASVVALPATPALATAGPNCITQNWEVCVYVNGSGLHINYMKGWMRNNSVDATSPMHIELEGPNGLIKNCATFVAPGRSNGPNCQWSPNRNVTAGRYCTTLWEYQAAFNEWINWGTECIDVHS
jgi:hypothetical protein